MSTSELWEEITSGPKWYAGLKTQSGSYHNAQSANRLKHRFREGTLSMKIITDIFKQLGYVRNTDVWMRASWIKQGA